MNVQVIIDGETVLIGKGEVEDVVDDQIELIVEDSTGMPHIVQFTKPKPKDK